MGLIEKAKDTLKDAAGGVRGARAKEGEARGERKPDEGKFEPEEVRRHKKPKDDLPQPEDFRQG